MATAVPHNAEVEAAVIGRLLREPELIGQVVGVQLEPQHFYTAANGLLYEAVTEAFYADESIEPTVIGELHAKRLGKMWRVEDTEAVRRVQELAAATNGGSPVENARLVKRDADYRRLLRLADDIRDRVGSENDSPEEIAGVVSQGALDVATSAISSNQELVSIADAGRAFVKDIRHARAAREQGVDRGAYFSLVAIDKYLRGIRGGELCVFGGEPGAGKSSLWWHAAVQFARREAKQAKDPRVGTLVISIEMGPEPSNARLASMFSGVMGTDIREGRITDRELQRIVDAWRERSQIPLWFNYAPTLRASQLRALISEAIRRHNVGLVVIDHFRMFDLDRRLDNKLDEDEEKVRFLKEQIAMSFNVAVVCLAHTRKPDPRSDGRPKMADLRGSYQVAAHSDFVGFVFRPAMYASQDELDDGEVDEKAAEAIWVKNRHGNPGTTVFCFDPDRMLVAD